jgi:hypothetical protein
MRRSARSSDGVAVLDCRVVTALATLTAKRLRK